MTGYFSNNYFANFYFANYYFQTENVIDPVIDFDFPLTVDVAEISRTVQIAENTAGTCSYSVVTDLQYKPYIEFDIQKRTAETSQSVYSVEVDQ
jgi:hypothetical protein